MAHVTPFRGLRFNPDRISFIARVVAPPYDVIDPELEGRLLAGDPHNMVRLTFGKTPPEGRPPETYQAAAELLRQWRAEGVLIEDEEPSYYLVEQTFEIGHKDYTRRGFVGAVRLEEPGEGGVFAHERTVERARSDRYELLKACRTNLSPLLGFFGDPDGSTCELITSLGKGRWTYSFRLGGVGYTVWTLSQEDVTAELSRRVEQQPLIIADGHHRYLSALRYARESRPEGAAPGSAPEDYVPFLCMSVADEGLVSLATHRLVTAGDKEEALRAIQQELAGAFTFERATVRGAKTLRDDFALACGAAECIGCYAGGADLWILRLANRQKLLDRFGEQMPSSWSLPVNLLHNVVLPDGLGIAPHSAEATERVTYTADAEQAYWAVESGLCDIAFLLPPTSPSQVMEAATRGELLPAKSTYFYPKLVSGLVLRALP